MRRVAARLICITFAVAGAAHLPLTPLVAQAAPGRPLLPQAADTNDWTAYFDFAAAILRREPNRADSAFHWASRIDPSRAEPLFGRWVAFWLKDLRRFQDYLEERPAVLESPAVRQADSFQVRALHRNPFVPQTLRVLPYAELPGRWRQDLATQAWLAYAEQKYQRAADLLARLIARNPEKHAWARFDRALAFVPLGRFDSARVEMRALLTTLRGRDASAPTAEVYESKDLVEYGLGLLALQQRDHAGARAAFERALVENLAFVPAHAMLGELALARGDRATAASELAQAVDLAPSDAWMRYRYGVVLSRIGRPGEAAVQLQLAVELEPFFADPYVALGNALEAAGDRAAAAVAYEGFLRRAPRHATERIAATQRRLAAARTGP